MILQNYMQDSKWVDQDKVEFIFGMWILLGEALVNYYKMNTKPDFNSSLKAKWKSPFLFNKNVKNSCS